MHMFLRRVDSEALVAGADLGNAHPVVCGDSVIPKDPDASIGACVHSI
jgi:hypothetical protein